MKNKIIAILIVSSLFFSCEKQKNRGKDMEEDKIPLYIPLKNAINTHESELLSSDASEIEYIALETTRQSVLKKIDKVIFLNKYILVSDFYNLYLFNKSGKFIKQVSQKGNGPQDYMYVNSIIPSKNDGFYLYTDYKIIKYDQDVNYIGNIPINNDLLRKNGSDCVILTPNNTIMFHITNLVYLKSDTTTIYCLTEIDTLGIIKKEYINNSPRYVASLDGLFLANTGTNSLYLYNNTVYYNEFGNDTLKIIKNDSLQPYAIINLDKFKMDTNPYIPFNRQEEVLDNFKKRLYLWNICESHRYLYFTMTWGFGRKNDICCIYDKTSTQIKNLGSEGFINDIDGGISFFPKNIEYSGARISWMDADVFKNEILSKNYEVMNTKYGKKFNDVYELALSVKEDDNPIIIIAK